LTTFQIGICFRLLICYEIPAQPIFVVTKFMFFFFVTDFNEVFQSKSINLEHALRKNHCHSAKFHLRWYRMLLQVNSSDFLNSRSNDHFFVKAGMWVE